MPTTLTTNHKTDCPTSRPVPQVMGILNVSPDSFFNESIGESVESAVARGVMLYEQGADVIDVGGEATSHARFPEHSRPTPDMRVSESEEMARVIPVLRELHQHVNCSLSVDTMRPRVAEAAIAAGATILNDQSGFKDADMRRVASESQAEVIVMHMQNTPLTMQLNPQYPNGVVSEIREFFLRQINLLVQAGVKEQRIILDPGICFGKTVEHNYEILKNLGELKALGFRILVGVSRKSLMTRLLHKPAEELLAPTIALNTLAVKDGADFLRVHDVKEHRNVIDLLVRAGYV